MDATSEVFDKSVYYTQSGQKFTQIVQFDANALYPTVMQGKQPTGLGVYLKKIGDVFEPELIAGQTFPRFSKISLQYLDMLQGWS